MPITLRKRTYVFFYNIKSNGHYVPFLFLFCQKKQIELNANNIKELHLFTPWENPSKVMVIRFLMVNLYWRTKCMPITLRNCTYDLFTPWKNPSKVMVTRFLFGDSLLEEKMHANWSGSGIFALKVFSLKSRKLKIYLWSLDDQFWQNRDSWLIWFTLQTKEYVLPHLSPWDIQRRNIRSIEEVLIS